MTDYFIRNSTFWHFLEIVHTCFLKKIFLKSSDICVFFYPRTSNFCNSELVGHRMLPYSLINNMFDVLSIRQQYTLSFKWSNFRLKCLVTITPKGQSLKFKASVGNFPISEKGKNFNSLFKLVDNNSVIIIEQRQKEYSWKSFERGFAKYLSILKKTLMSVFFFLLKLFIFDIFTS